MSRPVSEAASPAGETLVELLISIAILGIAGAGVIGVVMMGTAGSVLHEEITAADRLLRNWGESLQRTAYVTCAAPTDVTLRPEPTGWSGSRGIFTRRIKGVTYTATVAAVQYWSTGEERFTTTCDPDTGLQQLTLRMRVEGSGIEGTTEQLLVARRNPCRAVSETGCS